ncbi:MAG: hypothetical protein OSA95_11660 [Opitutales bacterium]|nr:hypothetical protein [Opitutales bacterium]
MKPRIKLAESTSPTGGLLELVEHDGSYSISLDGKELMHSRATASETLLGSLGVVRLGQERVGRVLIGGLGLGFTLASALESVGAETKVEVVEMVPEVIEWNRTHLQHLNGSFLDDPRVEIHTADVTRFIRKAEPATYDAILLDVDNGPVAMVSEGNASLYSRTGIRSICRALKQDGRIVFWSAGPDEQFESRLGRAGLDVEAVPARSHETARCASYRLFVAGFARPLS